VATRILGSDAPDKKSTAAVGCGVCDDCRTRWSSCLYSKMSPGRNWAVDGYSACTARGPISITWIEKKTVVPDKKINIATASNATGTAQGGCPFLCNLPLTFRSSLKSSLKLGTSSWNCRIADSDAFSRPNLSPASKSNSLVVDFRRIFTLSNYPWRASLSTQRTILEEQPGERKGAEHV